MAESKQRLLIQVVPRLIPGRCGISDHALALACELEAAFGIATAFIVLTSTVAEALPFPVKISAPARLLETCQSLTENHSGALLVHLSGYGYSPDGAPTALAAALEEVKASGRFRVAVYFHELFASGPPWKSAFWYSRRQKLAVSRIASACSLALTNTRGHAEWLQRKTENSPATQLMVLNVFSQVGEAEGPIAADQRDPAMVIFGLGGTRQYAYRQLASLGEMLRELEVKEFWDIGPEFDPPAELEGIFVRRFGALNREEVSAHLARARFGFVWHAPISLGKSGVFAGYCANGAVPVLASPFVGEFDGLKDGIHVLSPKTAQTSRISGFDRCSLAAWRWYSAHRLRVHAETYRQWLAESPGDRTAQTRIVAASARV